MLLMAPVLFAAHDGTGVYYSKADVRFLAPAPIEGNVFQADPLQTGPFASIVVHRFNAQDQDDEPHSTSAPLYGSGVRKGHLVYVPNLGGQWTASYSRPVITVEVVGESAEEVATERDEIVTKISELAESSQQERGLKASLHVTTELDLTTAFVSYVGVRNARAELALIFLTVGLTVGIPLSTDRIMARIRAAAVTRRRTKPSSGAQGPIQKSGSPQRTESQMAPPLM